MWLLISGEGGMLGQLQVFRVLDPKKMHIRVNLSCKVNVVLPRTTMASAVSQRVKQAKPDTAHLCY